MRRLAILFALVALFASAVPVSAGTQNKACAPRDAVKAMLYENSIRDTSDNDDRLWFCDEIISLAATDHLLPGNCNVANDFDAPDWARCVSSVAAWLPASHRMCMDWWVGKSHRVLQIIGPKYGARYDIPSDVIVTAWFTTGSCV